MSSLNRVLLGAVLALLLVAAGAWLWLGRGSADSSAPAPAAAAVAPPADSAPVVANHAPAPAAPAISAPAPLPEPIAKIAKEARKTAPPDRPLTQVSKSWLGCQSKQAYSDTMALLNQHSPAAAGAFQGDSPACVMLQAGQKVLLAFRDPDDPTAVQIRLEGKLLWTDPTALDGDGQ